MSESTSRIYRENGDLCQGQELETPDHIDDSGKRIPYERYVRVVSLARIDYGHQYKHLCEACPEYGKRFSCPPHSPFFPQYVDSARWAKVICVRFQQKHFGHLASHKKHLTHFFRKAGRVLVDALVEYRKQGYVIAGSGPCLACEQCAAEAGQECCSRPDGPIYSLESLGVNVAHLCKEAFGLDLEWSSVGGQAGHVCAVGAVFFKERDSGET